MAVAKGRRALDAVRILTGPNPVPISSVLQQPYLPEGFSVDPLPDGVGTESLIGGYGNPERYHLTLAPDVPLSTAGPASRVDASEMDAFRRSSLDLTMQGGVTSGVVYPLAICDLATEFRFRSIGGSSAGAIAAALTAAAEMGRSQSMLESAQAPESLATPTDNDSDPAPTAPPHEREPGSFRRGFVGMADIVDWMTQLHAGDRAPDQYRLAQLFRPNPQSHGLFLALATALKRRWWAFPIVLVAGLGPIAMVGTIVTALVSFLLMARLGSGLAADGSFSLGSTLLDGLCSLLFVAGALTAISSTGQIFRRLGLWLDDRKRTDEPSWLTKLRTVASITKPQEPDPGWLLLGLFGMLIAVIGLAVRSGHLLAAIIVGLASLPIYLLLWGGTFAGILSRARQQQYGLVSGASARSNREWLDDLAGVPEGGYRDAITPWLSGSLTALAGLPAGEVLRFGHLWDAEAYASRGSDTDDAAWRERLLDSSRRSITLEMITTDLTRRRPVRFPLSGPDAAEQLYFCPAELTEAFDSDVRDAMLGEEGVSIPDSSGHVRVLHKLPEPWDLPVVVAVRMSMAFPALFTAIPLYRLRWRRRVQDDLGRTIRYQGDEVSWIGESAADREVLAEQLWFSDGGITSNFPVHLFDQSMPRWPTVSLGLGSHPVQNPVADVSLPQDWEVNTDTDEPLSPSMFALFGAMFRTAQTWRDRSQTQMPGFRARVAQVRTHASEGGTNLFMDRGAIASLALRGALAGCRLRSRYSDPVHWDRYRWLRLRTAMSSFGRLRDRTVRSRGSYADALSGRDWLTEQQDNYPYPDVDWYSPIDGFWPTSNWLLDSMTPEDAEATLKALRENTPLPEPTLRQVPPG